MACGPIPACIKPVCLVGGQINTFVLCDDNGPFIYIIAVDGSITTVTTVDLNGDPYVPVGAIIPCDDFQGGADVEQRLFCDDNGPYLVAYEYDEFGAIVGSTTTLMDGTTPYVPVGTVTVCGGEEGGTEPIILCDDGTPFVRHVTYNNVGAVLTVVDTDLDMTTPYVVAGTVDICSPVTDVNTFNNDNLIPSGTNNDERLTVDGTAGGVQFAAFDAATTHVTWSVEPGGPVVVTFDGSAPSASNGHTLYPRDRKTWTKETATAAKWIRATANNGFVHASQFKPQV